MNILLKDSRFWAAVLVLINAILFYFMPDFPKEIWAAVDALAAVIIGSLATRTAVVTTRSLRNK